jgi:anti-sigma factor (TIGR02949 family)
MINCTDAVQRLWDYVEKDLDSQEQASMEDHLALCRRCCGEVEFAEEIRDLMKEASKPRIPDEVSERLSEYLDDLEGSAS